MPECLVAGLFFETALKNDFLRRLHRVITDHRDFRAVRGPQQGTWERFPHTRKHVSLSTSVETCDHDFIYRVDQLLYGLVGIGMPNVDLSEKGDEAMVGRQAECSKVIVSIGGSSAERFDFPRDHIGQQQLR